MTHPAQLPTQVSPPEFALSPALPHQIGGAGVWALALLPPAEGETDPRLGAGSAEAGEALGVDLAGAARALEATGKAGEITRLPGNGTDADLVLLVGVGAQSTSDLRRAGAALGRALKDRASVVTTIAAAPTEGAVEAVVVGAMLGSYEFHWRSEGAKATPVGRIVLAGVDGPDADEDLARGIALGGAGWRSRTLATVPSNLKNPAWLADQARLIAEENGLEVTVWDQADLEKDGFGGILAVGAGSASESRLIRLDYTPAGADDSTPTVVLVGKGITFDTGGLDIKPSDGMLTMKRDMSGGAAVLATLAALTPIGCPVKVVGLVPAAENAVGGASMRPGDVITHYGGRTTEVGNTDAEGRLVLADAMAYAVAQINPRVLVDVATLTGAMKVALGLQTAGYFATHDVLAEHVEAAAEASGEPVWRMPLASVYRDKLQSKIADADNAPGGPGAITAALFLAPFAGSVPWVHVDFASIAEAPVDRHEWTAGPTGFGPRLLLTWLGSDDPLDGVPAPRAKKGRK